MYFLSFCLSFTLFLSGYETIKPPGLKFSTIPLSHDGLLVMWDPNEVPNVRDTYFKVSYQLVEERVSRDVLELVNGVDGQFKTPVLNENAEYRLTIKKFVANEEPPTVDEYIIEARTGLRTNLPPAKPSFKFYKEDILFTQEKGPALKIRWLPCGTENNCNGQTAGGHFIIKYRMLHSNHSFSNVRFISDYGYIYNLLASKQYEVKVASILGDYETESEPQLVSFKTYTSSVKSSQIMSLTDASVLISWEPPATNSSPIIFYMIAYSSPNSGSLRFDPHVPQHLLKVDSSTGRWQAKLADLTPETQFTFYISPETLEGPGFESRIDFTPHLYESYIPLATPDFNHKILSNCSILIQWLPCGSSLCRNSRPGPSFSVQYRDSAGALTHIYEEGRDYVILDGKLFQTYDISVQSVDGPNTSPPVIKRIDISQC